MTETLSLRLAGVPGLVMIGRFTTDYPDLLREIATLYPDVTTVEIEPLGPATGTVLEAIHAACPRGQLVVLTASNDTSLAVLAAQAGASAWVAKSSTLEHLALVLSGVCDGHAWYPPEHLGAILRVLRSDAGSRQGATRSLDMLTRRQQEVMREIVAGKPYQQIASDLAIAEKTVRTHAANIFAKLNVHTRRQAVEVAERALCGGTPAASGPVRLV
ncbi:MAG: response regulator transcription factor [Jatrophihabitantaceae bacterium]